MSGYEILEHTADVGLRAEADSLERLFEVATEGMAVIAGSWHPGQGRERPLEVDGNDFAGVLVEWLSEALYEQDSKNASVAAVRLDEVSGSAARGAIALRDFAGEPSEGVQIKAVTFHQLAVERVPEGWRATVFFDV